MEDEKARCASMLPVRATLGYFFHLEQLHIIIKSENKMIEMPIIVIFVKAVNASFFFCFLAGTLYLNEVIRVGFVFPSLRRFFHDGYLWFFVLGCYLPL